MPQRAFLVLIAATMAVVGYAGCGGDDEGTTAGDPQTLERQQSAGSRSTGAGGAGQGGAGSKHRPPAGEDPKARVGDSRPDSLTVDVDAIPGARVTPTGAVQTRPPDPAAHAVAQNNSYSSIRSFGSEAEGEEATNISFALVQYLTATAQGDWATACVRLYSPLRENLERMASQASDPELRAGGCPSAFGALMSRRAERVRSEQAQIDISSIRRGDGNRAFVIYKTPDTLSADMPMYVEDGTWKVGALEAYALRPEQVG